MRTIFTSGEMDWHPAWDYDCVVCEETLKDSSFIIEYTPMERYAHRSCVENKSRGNIVERETMRSFKDKIRLIMESCV